MSEHVDDILTTATFQLTYLPTKVRINNDRDTRPAVASGHFLGTVAVSGL